MLFFVMTSFTTTRWAMREGSTQDHGYELPRKRLIGNQVNGTRMRAGVGRITILHATITKLETDTQELRDERPTTLGEERRIGRLDPRL